MQNSAEAGTSAVGRGVKSEIRQDVGSDLIKAIEPLVALQGVGPETLAVALREALLELGERPNGGENSEEGLRSNLTGLILRRIFAGGAALWIDSITEAGNIVPLDLLAAAYAMWRSAANLATRYGVDPAIAAEALARATHATADQLAKNKQGTESGEIRDVRRYVFAAYMYSIVRISAKQGLSQTDYVDMNEWVANRELSDKGAFLKALENGIFCRELLSAMPPRGKSVAVARYILGYSWPETAGAQGSSINAAQKALSAGVRQAVGICMRKMRRVGYRKALDAEMNLPRNKKSSFLR